MKYEVIAEGDCYQVGRMTISPGEATEPHRHRYRSETWVVVSGRGESLTGQDAMVLVPITAPLRIPHMTPHRVVNTGDDDLVVIEIQHGEMVGGEDAA